MRRLIEHLKRLLFGNPEKLLENSRTRAWRELSK